MSEIYRLRNDFDFQGLVLVNFYLEIVTKDFCCTDRACKIGCLGQSMIALWIECLEYDGNYYHSLEGYTMMSEKYENLDFQQNLQGLENHY